MCEFTVHDGAVALVLKLRAELEESLGLLAGPAPPVPTPLPCLGLGRHLVLLDSQGLLGQGLPGVEGGLVPRRRTAPAEHRTHTPW